jgi:hypothetical protein
MDINHIIRYCSDNQFAVNSDIVAAKPEVIRERFDEEQFDEQHYSNILTVKKHDPKLEVAIARIDLASLGKVLFLDLDENRGLVSGRRSVDELHAYLQTKRINMQDLLNRPDLIDPSWARRVLDVHYSGFMTSKVGPLPLQPPSRKELADTKTGCWTLADGNHRVLATIFRILIERRYDLEEVEVILTWFDRERLESLRPSVKL